MAKTIALATATFPEFRHLAALWPLQPSPGDYTYRFHNMDVIVCITGMGSSRARSKVEQLLAEHHVDRLILCGFAGGLDPGLETGSVVVPQRIIDDRGNATTLSDQQQPTILTVEQMVTQPQQKRKLSTTSMFKPFEVGNHAVGAGSGFAPEQAKQNSLLKSTGGL